VGRAAYADNAFVSTFFRVNHSSLLPFLSH
jgi:hypothetical protein